MELLRAVVNIITCELHVVLTAVWQCSTLLPDWKLSGKEKGIVRTATTPLRARQDLRPFVLNIDSLPAIKAAEI